jgi:hypothetical protein
MQFLNEEAERRLAPRTPQRAARPAAARPAAARPERAARQDQGRPLRERTPRERPLRAAEARRAAQPPRTPPRTPPPAAQAPRVPGVIVPASAERRIVPDELILRTREGLGDAPFTALLRRHGLERIASERFALLGQTLHRVRLRDGRTPRQALQGLTREPGLLAAQPNYVHSLPPPQISRAADMTLAASANRAGQGALPQYALGKLGVPAVHGLSQGARVAIAVVDSAIDMTHPELKDAVAKSYDALAGRLDPAMAGDSHGTGMASAILARDQLRAVAPEARLLSARAFIGQGEAKGNSWHVLRAVDWSVAEGARVLNLSFAGPRDALVSEALAAASARGVIAVAAAGNAGPRSEPLFPGSDPHALAVTALDERDQLFAMANRGRHIALAAPGVDVLVAQPQGGYGLTTGTSVATAHVSGVVALLLARDPTLTLARLRALLTATARDLGPSGPDPQFGAGHVDPAAALLRLPAAGPQAAR